MCLGVPGQIIEVVDAGNFLATAEMSDAKRTINIALVDADGIAPGDWVLVHAGFALNKMTAEEALEARRILQEMADAYADEVGAAMGGMADEVPRAPSPFPGVQVVDRGEAIGRERAVS